MGWLAQLDPRAVMIGIGAALESTAFSALAFVMIPLYYTLGHGSASGQTLGKKACSIAVRRAAGCGGGGFGSRTESSLSIVIWKVRRAASGNS